MTRRNSLRRALAASVVINRSRGFLLAAAVLVVPGGLLSCVGLDTLIGAGQLALKLVLHLPTWLGGVL